VTQQEKKEMRTGWMRTMFQKILARGCVLVMTTATTGGAIAQTADAIAAPGETVITTLHAQGVQVYECKAGASGALAWEFREPVATLIQDGKTIGRHYAGPRWELQDGSTVAATVSAREPGATASDIPVLKLAVTDRRGSGMLADVSTIQRINTKGGVAKGDCPAPGMLLSVPYSADYAFLTKAR
jgi:hypothetical protein